MKDNYVLNLILKDKTNDELIKIVEEKIAEHGRTLTEINPYFEQAKSDFEKLQLQVKMENESLQELDILYKALVAYRNHSGINKELRVMRTTSVLEKPVKQKRQYKLIKWNEYITPILKEANKFMSDWDIWDTIDARYGEQISKLGGTKYKMRDSLYASSKQRNKKRPDLYVYYNGKYGLPSWVDENKIPLPQYLFIGGTVKQMAS